MKITYRLTRRDIFFATAEAQFQQPVMVAFLAIVLVFISYQNWQALSPDRSLLVRLITFGILELIPVLALTVVVGLFILITAASPQNKTLLSEQMVTLDENFLGCQSEYVRSEVRWKAVQRIVRTGNYLYLYLSQLGAMIVPRRAFSSKEQFERFVEFCSTKSRSSKSASTGGFDFGGGTAE